MHVMYDKLKNNKNKNNNSNNNNNNNNNNNDNYILYSIVVLIY